MKKLLARPFALLIAACALIAPPCLGAQVFQELYSFNGVDINGCLPEGPLVQGTDGNFYGTASSGGQPTTNDPAGGNGTVFRIAPEGTLTTIAWFNGTNGVNPSGAMVQATDGNFYGICGYGLFRVTPSGVLAVIAGGDVSDPIEGSDGCLYVADSYYESVYRFPIESGTGDQWAVAGHPSGGLLQASDGNYYGLTSDGGNAYGTAYKITGDTLTTLAVFPSGGQPAFPYDRLMQASDGNLYGVDDWEDVGSVFRLTLSGVLTNIAYCGIGNSGQSPNGPLIQANDGNFYGTTMEGGSSCCPGNIGTVFKMTPEGVMTTLFSFTDQKGPYFGANPYGGLVQGSDGNLYGTCALGGSHGGGNVFRILMPGPLLSSSQAGSNLVLSWRTNYVGYTLQSSLDLTNWSACTNPPSLCAGLYCATNTLSAGAEFFRLIK
jgi:uncharacterized repeat protein (TIGR03803 family)